MTSTTNHNEMLHLRAKALRRNRLVEHWPEVDASAWLAPMLQSEEDERTQRALQGRISAAKLGKFKILPDFDWDWPKRIDRMAVEELMSLSFLEDATKVVLIGPNGVSKSTLAHNVAHQELIQGRTVLFKSASECSANSQRWTATRRCADACSTTPRRSSW